jgi:hypothetical protein
LVVAVGALMVVGAVPVSADAEANLQTVMEYHDDVVGRGHAAHVDSHHEDVQFRSPQLAFGFEQANVEWESLVAAFPDLNIEMISTDAGDGWVVANYTLSGTFTEDFTLPGGDVAPPTGNAFSVDVHEVFIFDDEGLIIHQIASYDSGSQTAQLIGAQ